MYFICAANGREEGPLTESQIAERIHTRRLTPSSYLKGPGATEPRPVESFQEFRGPLRQYAEMTAILEAPRRSRLAVTSLVLGITALLGALVTYLAASRLQEQVLKSSRERQAAAAEQARLSQESRAQRRRAPAQAPTDKLQRLPEKPAAPSVQTLTGTNPPPPGTFVIAPGPGGTRTNIPAAGRPQRQGPDVPQGLVVTTLTAAAVSILSLFSCLVTGSVALIHIRKPSKRLVGRELAIGGLACGGAMLALVGLGTWQIVSQIPVQEVKRYAQYEGRMRALSQIHQTATAGGKAYPSVEKWCDELATQIPANSDALGSAKTGCRFGFNARLEGKHPKDVPRDTVAFFELRKPGWNMAGGQGLIKRPGDLAEKVVVVTADGRARLIPSLEVDGLRWDP